MLLLHFKVGRSTHPVELVEVLGLNSGVDQRLEEELLGPDGVVDSSQQDRLVQDCNSRA